MSASEPAIYSSTLAYMNPSSFDYWKRTESKGHTYNEGSLWNTTGVPLLRENSFNLGHHRGEMGVGRDVASRLLHRNREAPSGDQIPVSDKKPSISGQPLMSLLAATGIAGWPRHGQPVGCC